MTAPTDDDLHRIKRLLERLDDDRIGYESFYLKVRAHSFPARDLDLQNARINTPVGVIVHIAANHAERIATNLDLIMEVLPKIIEDYERLRRKQ